MKNKNKFLAKNHLKENMKFYFLYNGKDLLGSPSGLRILDRSVEGFFGLVGVTGVPGKGKTTLAIQTTIHNIFTLNKPVLYVSMEVDKDLLIAKIVSHMTGIKVKKILKGGMNYVESKHFLEALQKVYDTENLRIIDAKDTKFKTIEEEIIKFKEDYLEEYGVEEEILTVIDYLNIMNDVPKGNINEKSDSNDKTKAQMTEFIRIKNDTKANFFIILAKNKKGYGEKSMGAIKGSGDLEYGFETIISLEDPEEEFPTSDYPENRETGFKEVNTMVSIFKARWEDTNKIIPLYFDGTKFYEP